MKAMLLAAGRGERMRPLTDTLPKPLLPVGGQTLIERHLERLAAAGFREVVINLRHLGSLIEAQLGDGSPWGMTIAWSRETDKLETGGGIKQALPLLGDAPFALINADVYTDFDFSLLQTQLPDGSLGKLIMTDNPSHHPDGDFGLTADLLTAKKPHLTYTGIALLHPNLVKHEPQTSFPLRKKMDEAIAKAHLHGHHHKGRWQDIGTEGRYTELLTSLEQ